MRNTKKSHYNFIIKIRMHFKVDFFSIVYILLIILHKLFKTKNTSLNNFIYILKLRQSFLSHYILFNLMFKFR
jgi:hypothetical protein